MLEGIIKMTIITTVGNNFPKAHIIIQAVQEFPWFPRPPSTFYTNVTITRKNEKKNEKYVTYTIY